MWVYESVVSPTLKQVSQEARKVPALQKALDKLDAFTVRCLWLVWFSWCHSSASDQCQCVVSALVWPADWPAATAGVVLQCILSSELA